MRSPDPGPIGLRDFGGEAVAVVRVQPAQVIEIWWIADWLMRRTVPHEMGSA
jgi:hypothetical protein